MDLHLRGQAPCQETCNGCARPDQWRDDQCDRCNRVGHERFLVVHLYSDMEPWEEFGRAHRCKTPEECGLCEGINYSVGTVVADG